MATSPWYREGTAKFTEGSTTVTGTGTRWVDFVRAGDGIQGPDGKLYQVTNVASNTSMSITPAYGSETTYWTIPIQGYVKRLADAASQMLRDFDGAVSDAQSAASAAQSAASAAQSAADSSLKKASNLSDLTNAGDARANLGLTSLATLDLDALSNGRIVVMKTPKGQPTHMYRLPAFNCEDVDPSGALGTGLHPAFIFNGVPEREIYVGAYPASEVNGEIVCQPGLAPRVSLNFDQSRQKCRDLGAGWDIMSNWDWAAIALWCMANGFQPRGNTQFGRNHDRRFETGTRIAAEAPGVSTGSGATLTGSGPASWTHDGTPMGIHDLVGNVWDWASGLILRDNLFEVAPDNGDYAEAQYTKTGFAAVANGTFSGLSYTEPPEILRRALAVPTTGVAPIGNFWKNAEGERLLLRGGSWITGGTCGLGALYLHNDRGYAVSSIGFRPRFRNL